MQRLGKLTGGVAHDLSNVPSPALDPPSPAHRDPEIILIVDHEPTVPCESPKQLSRR